MHRAGLFRASQPHRFAHDFRNGIRVVNRCRPFGHRLEHADHVHNLMRFLMQPLGRTLAGQYQHRCAIHVRIGHARDQVGRTGPQGTQAARRVAGQATINFGHKGRALFMAGQHKANLVGLLQRQHEIGILFARYAKDGFNAFLFQAAHHQVGCFHRFSPDLAVWLW